MRSYLLSTLRREFGSSDRSAFVAAAPHAWLLWSIGQWRPSLQHTEPLPSLHDEPPAPPSRPIDEALAIELVPLTRPVVLGRAEDCDLVINDGRVSARHLAFHFGAEGWAAEDLNSTNGTRIDGHPLAAGERARLRDGMTIDAARVLLEFHSSEGLWPRLAEP